MGGGKCGRSRCFPCRGPKGGNCWREGVTYSLWCEECGEKVAAYQGETGRNGFTRGKEHLDNLEARNEDKSVLWLHSIYHHQRREDIQYSMRVTGGYKDSLDRQVMERVQISNWRGPVRMNRKNEMGGVRVERTQYRIWGGDEGEVGKLEVPPPFTFLSCTVEGEVECKPGRRSLGGLEERGGRGLFFEGHHLE